MDYHQMEILGPNLLDLVHHHHPHQILYNFHDQAEILITSVTIVQIKSLDNHMQLKWIGIQQNFI